MSGQVIEQDPIPKSGPGASGRPSHPQHPLANYQFSSDELRVLRECNTESFFQRSLPFGTILGASTYYAVRQGFLTPNAKYGATPKVVMSVIVGYFLGKFSYQNKCAEKMIQLPNSRLAQMLRQRKQQQRGGTFYDNLPQQGLSPGFGLSSFGSSGSDIYSDEGLRSQTNALDLDTERPPQKELDDIYKPTLDSPAIVLEENSSLEPPTPSLSYEELRKKNREDYLKTRTPNERPPQFSSKPIITAKPEEPENQKNKYGDVWS